MVSSLTSAPDLITTEYDGSSTATQVVAGRDLSGLRAVVTGGGSGIGLATTRALVEAGADVTIAARTIAAAAEGIRTFSAPARARVRISRLDLADLRSIAQFAADWDGPLHLLINNAGIVTGGLERTPQGLELQFATNYLGHFALTRRLHRALRLGAGDRGGARIVNVSSTALMRANLDFDDLQFQQRPYQPQIAYAQSKTANSLFSVESTRRWRDHGAVANTANPGGVASGLQRNFTPEQRASLAAAEAAGTFRYKTPDQGAATTLTAAIHPAFAHTGGHYLDDCREAYTVPDDALLADHPHGVKRWALDPDAARELWRVSTRLLETCGSPSR